MSSFHQLFKQRVAQQQPKTFGEFHDIVCKAMPNAGTNPAAYNQCYDLMKLEWETANQNNG